MRLLITTLGTLFVTFILFLTVKFWGFSAKYAPYEHPVLSNKQTLIYEYPSANNLIKAIRETQKPLYLNVGLSSDQKLILIKDLSQFKTPHVHKMTSQALLVDHYLFDDQAEYLKNRPLIINFLENPIGADQFLFEALKKMNFTDQSPLIIKADYEILSKSLKELAPSFIFATSAPEILKLKSMESLFLIEAATVRSDVVIHPLKLQKQNFYTAVLLTELDRRFKKFIVGPIEPNELDESLKLKPLGVIVKE